LYFSFSSSGNTFANLEEAKFLLSTWCSESVWRSLDRRIDDSYTAASVKHLLQHS